MGPYFIKSWVPIGSPFLSSEVPISFRFSGKASTVHPGGAKMCLLPFKGSPRTKKIRVFLVIAQMGGGVETFLKWW